MSNYIIAITTTDNPYSPFDDFGKWFAYDTTHGYNSCGYLARLVKVSSAMSDDEYLAEIEKAMDEMVKYNLTGVKGVSYVKLKKSA